MRRLAAIVLAVSLSACATQEVLDDETACAISEEKVAWRMEDLAEEVSLGSDAYIDFERRRYELVADCDPDGWRWLIWDLNKSLGIPNS